MSANGIDAGAIESQLQQAQDGALSREQVDEVLAQLAERIGLDELLLDEAGMAELTVDDEIDITLVHLPHLPGVIAATPLPDAPDARGDLLIRLLQANMSWELTHGGVIGMLPPDKDLMLCRLIPLIERDAEKLELELVRFVELAGAWEMQIEDFLAEQEDEPAEAEAGVPPPGSLA